MTEEKINEIACQLTMAATQLQTTRNIDAQEAINRVWILFTSFQASLKDKNDQIEVN